MEASANESSSGGDVFLVLVSLLVLVGVVALLVVNPAWASIAAVLASWEMIGVLVVISAGKP